MSTLSASHPSLYVSKLDLSLPALNTGQGPGTSRDRSRTEAKLLRGFFENVKFVPWKLNEYQSMITNALKELDDISSGVHNNLNYRLQFVRDKINEDVVHRPLSERRLKKLKKSAALEGVTSPSKQGAEETKIENPSAVPIESIPNGPEEGQVYPPGEARKGKKKVKRVGFAKSVKTPRITDNRIVYGKWTEIEGLTAELMPGIVNAFNDMLEISHVDEWYRVITKEQRLPLDYTRFKISPSTRGTKHTPDKSLVRMRGKEQVGAPLCAYEYKGPRMNLAYHAIEHEKYIRAVESPPSKKFKSDPTSKPHEQAGEDLGEFIFSADVMTSYFNGMFGKIENCYSETRDSFTTEEKLGPIAQTLSQGLCTESGCCLLYTHQQAIAFEICDRDADGKMVVKTSPLVRCNSPRGTIALKIAISHYSLEKAEVKERSELLKELSTMLKEAADDRHPTRKNDEHQPDENDTEDGGSKGGNGKRNEKDSSQKKGNEGGKSAESEKKSGSNGEKGAQENSSFTSAISNLSNNEAQASARTVQDVLKEFADSSKRANVEGGSGLLFFGSADGTRIVIKVWNEEDSRGLLEVMNEIKIYKHIESECPKLLGGSIPRIILAKSKPQRNARFGGDVYLMTEYVGESVNRANDGILRVGSGDNAEELGENEEMSVRNAACSSLKALHDNNILHGDVAFRNLRVARRNNSEEWEAWWIDLGRAMVDYREHSFDKWIERRDCERLFSGEE